VDYHQNVLPVLDLAGVAYTSANATRNRVVIGIEDPASRSAVASVVRMSGVPEAAVVVEETPAVIAASDLNHRIRPVIGGLRVNHGSVYRCTLGVNVHDPQRGIEGFLTASHCTHPDGEIGVETGVGFYQSSWGGSTHYIGWEVEDPPFRPYGRLCDDGQLCRYSDAALFRYASGADFERGWVARTSINSTSISGEYRIRGKINVVFEGQPLRKVGATTGTTAGNVSHECLQRNLSGNRRLMCQVRVTAEARGGDSGSPVIELFGSTGEAYFAGVLAHAATDFQFFEYGPIGGIEDDFGRSFDVVAPTPALSARILGPTYIASSGDYLWTADVEGGDGTYAYNWYYRIDQNTWTCSYQTTWSHVGTGPAYSRSVPVPSYDFRIGLEVTSAGQTVWNEIKVYVENSDQMICPMSTGDEDPVAD
jgi:hypothetical protein